MHLRIRAVCGVAYGSLVPEAGFEPARPKPRDFRTTSAFAASARPFVVWSTPSPWP